MSTLSPYRRKGRLPKLSRQEQRLYGAAWDDLPIEIAVRIKQLFKATGCMDLYDSPCQFLDVAIQCFQEKTREVEGCRKLLSQMRELIGEEQPQ